MTSALPDLPELPFRLIDGGCGPYLFLVHGMLSGGRQWDANLDKLLTVSRPVVFDLWGHGGAPVPEHGAAYEVEALIAGFERVRDELGAQRVVLCGQSFGASLTLRYSIMHPERVAAQIFTNSVSALSPPEVFGSAQARAERSAAIEAGGHAVLEQLPFHPARALRLPEELRARMVAMAREVDPRAVARLGAITGPRLSVLGDLDRIACPTLLVNGVREKAFQPLRDLAAARIAGCHVADIDAGHVVNLESPAQFDAAVIGFLSRQ